MKKIQFSMGITTIRLLLVILFATVFATGKIKAADYYWVGGTGNWNDFANHWATASGGTTFHTNNPAQNDHVIFDANSFVAAGDTVYLNVPAVYCDTLDWNNVQNDPVIHSILNSSVNISGSLIISSGTNFHFSSDPGTKIQVNISGDWENNGNFIAGNSRITFNGASLQHIGGANSTIFHELKIDNINGVQQDMAVTVDDTLVLTIGKFILNGKTVTLNNSSIGALTRTNGYLYSEDVPPNYGMINWKIGTTLGIHTFPFINAAGDYVPFIYDHILGNSDLTVATYRTLTNLTPLPTTVTNINDPFGVNNAPNMVQRYWILNETGTGNSGDLTFNYSPAEQPTNGAGPSIISQRWDGSSWKVPLPGQTNPSAYSNKTPGVTQFNTVWVLTKPTSTLGSPYYWVGGTGNWSDFANHWATSSGGTTFHLGPPSPLDDVYFDGNSFPSINQDVLIDLALVFCKDFNWQSTVPGCRLYNVTVQNKISVFGSIFITNYPLQYGGGGIMSLESTLTNNTIDIQDTTYINLEFNNPAGAWTLSQPLTLVPKIRLKAGTLNTNNYPVNCGGIISNYGTANRFLNAGTTVFTVTDFSSPATIISVDTFAFRIDDLLNFNYINKNIYFKIATNNVDSTFWFNNVKEFELNALSYQFENVYVENDVVNGWPNLFRFNIYTQDTLVRNVYGNGDGFIYVRSPMGNLTVDSLVITNSLQTGYISVSSSDTLKVNYMEAAAAVAGAAYSDIKKVIANAKPLTPTSGFGTSGIIENVFINGNLNINTGSKNLLIKKCVILQNGTFNTEVYFDTLMINQGFNYTIQQGDTITINDQFIANGTLGNYTLLQSSTVGTQANIQFPQGNICSDYLMIRDINAIGSNISAGANSIDLGNNSGWLFSPCTPQLSNVWPGDANYDLTANNFDVLNIGLAYGETGPVRAGASNNWVAQPATDWSSFFLSAVNKKHADCDGNGVVDNNDTLAISLNYGLTHPARLASQNSNQTTAPPLYLVANPDTVTEGDTVEVDIFLGTQTVPVDSIYGIAFTMDFDTSLVDTSHMPFDYTGCWMGTPGVDLLTYTHKLFSEGKVDIALTRTDHLNLGGYGFLGKAGVVIVDNVGARIANTIPYVTLPLSISNVRALTASEFYLTISTNGDNVEIDTSGVTGIIHTNNLNEMISVYPNPVKDMLTINPGKAKINSLEIYNSMGEIVLRKKASAEKISINTENYSRGIYFLKLQTEAGSVNKKFSIIK